jgi:hypothetical protein
LVRPWRKAEVVVLAAVLVEEPVVARAQEPVVARVREPAVPGRARVAEQPVVLAGHPVPGHLPGPEADRAAPAAAGSNTLSAAARELRARVE